MRSGHVRGSEERLSDKEEVPGSSPGSPTRSRAGVGGAGQPLSQASRPSTLSIGGALASVRAMTLSVCGETGLPARAAATVARLNLAAFTRSALVQPRRASSLSSRSPLILTPIGTLVSPGDPADRVHRARPNRMHHFPNVIHRPALRAPSLRFGTPLSRHRHRRGGANAPAPAP